MVEIRNSKVILPQSAYYHLRNLARQAIGREDKPVEFSPGCRNCDELSWPITYFCYAQGPKFFRQQHEWRMRQIKAYPVRLPK